MNKNDFSAGNSLSEILKPFTSRWRFFILSIISFLIAGIIYIIYTAPVFRVESKILIKDAKKSMAPSTDVAGLGGIAGIGGMSANSIENELQVITSKNIADKIVKDLGLQVIYFRDTNRYNVELFGNESPFKIQVISEKPEGEFPEDEIFVKEINGKVHLESSYFDSDVLVDYNKLLSLPFGNIMIIKNKNYQEPKKKVEAEYFVRIIPVTVAVENLQKDLVVTLADEESTVMRLEMIYQNRDKAKRIINSVIDIYNNDAKEDKAKEDQKSKDFIDERLSLIANDLSNVEDVKQNFKRSNNIVDLATQGRIDLQSNTEASQRMLDMGTKLELNDMMISYLNTKKYDLLPSSIGVDNPTAAAMISSYNSLVIQRKKLLENATLENPLVLALTSQIDDLNTALKRSIQKSRDALQIARNQIVKQQDESVSDIKNFPVSERNYRGIERQQQIKENLYLLLLEKREEASIKLAMTTERARTIDSAYSSIKPVAPKKIITIALCFLLGVIFPLLFILIKNLLNDKVLSKHDIEIITDDYVIAEIPHKNKSDEDVINGNLLTPVAEAFRILSTNLKFSIPNKESAAVVLITSSVKGEGKTFIAMNTACTLAISGKKTLLIGADIRNPQLQRYSKVDISNVGLSEYLYDNSFSEQDIIFKSDIHNNLDLILSGTIPPNPADLLSNGKIEKLIDFHSANYDFIIIDAAPMMPVTDTSIIAKYADTTIYTVRSNYSKKQYIKYYSSEVSKGILNNSFLVINDVKNINLGYGNSLGYGYSQEEVSFWKKYNPFSRS